MPIETKSQMQSNKEKPFLKGFRDPQMPRPSGKWFGLALMGVKYPANIGGILRLAVNFNASVVWILKRYKRFKTDTTNAAKKHSSYYC